MKIRLIKILVPFIIPILILLLPRGWFGINNFTIIEHRTIAIFFMAALLWVLEPIPIYATSIVTIIVILLTISDSSLIWLVKEDINFGNLLSYREVMGSFASPIILLFLGGFFLALSASKYRLDINLARVLLKPFGSNTSRLLLGIMMITAFFSMFMSNTATTAMMLSIVLPLLTNFEQGDKARISFMLAIPLAANIGGIGTPIGTPPNAIALKYLTGENSINFSQWMAFGIPYVILLILIGWFLLLKMFPAQKREVRLDLKGSFQKNPKSMIVYATFFLTILLWLTDFLHGVNAYTVALVPVAMFLAFGIVSKEDLKKLNWDVLWLVSGGIALGLAMDKTGLAKNLINSIPFANYSPYLIIIMASIVAAIMANFMSNTATANLLLPLMFALGATVESLGAIGGVKSLILGVALSSSMGMALPISTPPNALAHATDSFETKDMAKIGIAVGLIGLILIYCFLFILKTINFF